MFLIRLILGLVVLLSAPYAQASTPKKTSLIFDTRCDTDDMMALLYLLKEPQVDIKTITTIGNGISDYENRVRNILNFLEFAGKPQIPVSYGEQTSFSPAGSFPLEWIQKSNKMKEIKLPQNAILPIKKTSYEVITNLVMNSPSKPTILCTGPMTNLALALKKTPKLKEKIEQIFIVGGAVVVPGNITKRVQGGFLNRFAEYNVFIDAKAASDILSSGIPITLVPLDAMQYVPVKPFLPLIAEDRKTAFANFVYELTLPSTTQTKDYFWSPLAAMLIVHPEIAIYREIKFTINLKKGPEYGRLMMTKKGIPVSVATSVDSQKFYELFLETLNKNSF